MTLKQYEREIWMEARTAFENPKLKLKELLEWSTGAIKPREGECTVYLPRSAICVAISKANDRRN